MRFDRYLAAVCEPLTSKQTNQRNGKTSRNRKCVKHWEVIIVINKNPPINTQRSTHKNKWDLSSCCRWHPTTTAALSAKTNVEMRDARGARSSRKLCAYTCFSRQIEFRCSGAAIVKRINCTGNQIHLRLWLCASNHQPFICAMRANNTNACRPIDNGVLIQHVHCAFGHRIYEHSCSFRCVFVYVNVSRGLLLFRGSMIWATPSW